MSIILWMECFPVMYCGFPDDDTCFSKYDSKIHHAILISNCNSFVVTDATFFISSLYCCSIFYKIFHKTRCNYFTWLAPHWVLFVCLFFWTTCIYALCLLSLTAYQSVLFPCLRSSFLNASFQLPIPRSLLKSPSETDSRWLDEEIVCDLLGQLDPWI